MSALALSTVQERHEARCDEAAQGREYGALIEAQLRCDLRDSPAPVHE
jgi:hypothetical protein